MAFYRGPKTNLSNLLLYIDSYNNKCYSGSGNYLYNLINKTTLTKDDDVTYNEKSFIFNANTNGIIISDNIPNGDLSIDLIINNKTENGFNRYIINSTNTEIKSYGNSNVFYFLRKVNDISASFGESTYNGYTGISFEIDLNVYNFITITHNSVSGLFKVYKYVILYKTTDGFYYNTTGQSTGYSGLVGNTGGFKIGQ